MSMVNDETLEMTKDEEIWYFGYGPIVHPQVRERRGVKTSCEQAAVLRDYRLTFAFGGVATIVPKTGFTVHGVVMKLEDEEAWNKLKEFDSGYYVQQELDVYTYDPNDFDDGTDEIFESQRPVQCYCFVMTNFDESKLPSSNRDPIEKKPQERYLRLIANGMIHHGVDETYVSDEIMACPFIPSRKEEEWYTFPPAKEHLPKISFKGYQRLCKRRPNDLYFIMNGFVIKADLNINKSHSNNPAVEWMKEHAHGKEDKTLLVHKIVVEPGLPCAKTKEELTERHYRWAVHHIFDFLQNADVTAQQVFVLSSRDDDDRNSKNNSNSSKTTPPQTQQQQESQQPPCSRQQRRRRSSSLRNSIQQVFGNRTG